MFSKRIISMLVVLSFISQALVVVDTDSYSSVVVEDSSILEELSPWITLVFLKPLK